MSNKAQDSVWQTSRLYASVHHSTNFSGHLNKYQR